MLNKPEPEPEMEPEPEPSSLVLNRTIEDIQREIGDMVLSFSPISNTLRLCPTEICEKLFQGGYVVVQELYQLQKGRYIRWLDSETGKLATGGIVVDILFKEKGVWILYKGFHQGMYQYRYDNTITFQKMTRWEQTYLALLTK